MWGSKPAPAPVEPEPEPLPVEATPKTEKSSLLGKKPEEFLRVGLAGTKALGKTMKDVTVAVGEGAKKTYMYTKEQAEKLAKDEKLQAQAEKAKRHEETAALAARVKELEAEVEALKATSPAARLEALGRGDM